MSTVVMVAAATPDSTAVIIPAANVLPTIQKAVMPAILEAKEESQLEKQAIVLPQMASVDSETVQHKLVRDIMHPDESAVHQIKQEPPISLQQEQKSQPSNISIAKQFQPSIVGDLLTSGPSIGVLLEFEASNIDIPGRFEQLQARISPISLSHLPHVATRNRVDLHLAATVTFRGNVQGFLPESDDHMKNQGADIEQQVPSQSIQFLCRSSVSQQEGAIVYSEVELSPRLPDDLNIRIAKDLQIHDRSEVIDHPKVNQCRLNLQRIESILNPKRVCQ